MLAGITVMLKLCVTMPLGAVTPLVRLLKFNMLGHAIIFVEFCATGGSTVSYPSFSSVRFLGQDVNCSGTEYSLSSCSYSLGISDECYVGNRIAGVSCTEGSLRF